MNQKSASRSTHIWSLLALVTMALCAASTIVDAINANFFTGRNWPGAYLVFACMLAAIDGWYVGILHFTQNRIRWLYRLLEFVGLFIFLVLPWSGAELGTLDTPDGAAALVKLVIWTLAGYEMIILVRRFAKEMTSDLLHLNQPMVDDPSAKPQTTVRLATLQIRVLLGGAAMLIAIATVIGWARLNETEPTLNQAASAVTIFIYSVTGLLLLGQAQFAILRNSWKDSNISISFSLQNHWLRSNLLLIILIACVTFALPTPVAITPPVHLESNFKPTQKLTLTPTLTPTPPTIPKSTPAPPTQKPPDTSWKFLDNALSLIWKNLSLLLAQVIANIPTVFLLIGACITTWLFWGFLRRGRPVTQSPNSSHTHQHKESVAASQPARFTPMRRALTSRDQVYAYYMSLLTRARQSGLERRPSQTPYEHTVQLISELPDSQEALNQLTQAFIEARYSQQNIEAEDVNQARTLWQRIRTTLRTYKQKSSQR